MTIGKTQSFFDVPRSRTNAPDRVYAQRYRRQRHSRFRLHHAIRQRAVGHHFGEEYSSRRANVVDLTGTSISGGQFVVGTSNTSDNHGNEVPDIVGNLRVDQAWGSAQISGALHLNQAQYYGAPSVSWPPRSATQGHPDDKWGYALAAGITLKMPWDPKDTFHRRHVRERGDDLCLEHAGRFRRPFRKARRSTRPMLSPLAGWMTPISAASRPPLTGYAVASCNCPRPGTSKRASSITGRQHCGRRSGALTPSSKPTARRSTSWFAVRAGFGPGCADFSAWQIGSRTIWNPVANLDIGLEVMYTKVNTAFEGGTAVTGASVSPGAITGGGGGTIGVPTATLGGPGIVPATNTVDPIKRIGDTHVWSGILRFQRNFWP